MGNVSGKMISSHPVGTGSDLQGCNSGEGLADIFLPTQSSYLENEIYF